MRIRRVKGNIIKRTGGDYNMYAGGSIITTSNGKITETAGEGITYGEPEQYNHKDSCEYTPNPVKIGGCDYYILRVEDFFKRHPECKHFPPVYYYGSMRVPSTLSKGDESEIRSYEPYGHKAPYPRIDEGKKKKHNEEEIKTRRANTDHSQPTFIKSKGPLMGSFYTGTLEESYGTKYCNAFTKLRPQLTKKGQEWLDDTMLNLQKLMEKGVVDKEYIAEYNKGYNKRNGLVDSEGAPVDDEILERFYRRIELNEIRFKDFAFASHPDAYNPKRMQELPLHDLQKIARTPDFEEWWNSETWSQAWNTGKNINYRKVAEATWEKIKEDDRKHIEKLRTDK